MRDPGQYPLSRRQALAAAGTLLVSATELVAQDSRQEAGATLLFDGRTLSGWHTNPQPVGHGTGGLWQVEAGGHADSGVLTGQQDPPGSGNGGLLLTDKKFGDFELTLEMNPDWGPCSGVFFRCTDAGAGFQMYVDYHDGGNIGHLLGEMPGAFAMKPFKFNGVLDGSGKLSQLVPAADLPAMKWPPGVYESTCTLEDFLAAWKVGEWNAARIRCVGAQPKISVWINQLQVCRFNGETCTLPAYDKDRVLKQLGPQGSIGLQVHGGKDWPQGTKCRWRNIRIREL
jgi:hypothetical protein